MLKRLLKSCLIYVINSLKKILTLATYLQTPYCSHLHLKEIKEIKAELDKSNINFYEQVLENVNLKSGVSREEAIEYFLIFQESFNYYFHNKVYGDFRKLFTNMSLN